MLVRAEGLKCIATEGDSHKESVAALQERTGNQPRKV